MAVFFERIKPSVPILCSCNNQENWIKRHFLNTRKILKSPQKPKPQAVFDIFKWSTLLCVHVFLRIKSSFVYVLVLLQYFIPRLTSPIFLPHHSRIWVIFPSARGLPVSLSITLDISQGKWVFSTNSIRESMPKSGNAWSGIS